MEQVELTQQFKQEVTQLIQNKFQKVKVIHIALLGSSGKGLRSIGSDFDIQVMTIDQVDNYILGRVFESQKLKLNYNKTQMEGIAFDLRFALDKIAESNPTLMEILNAPAIYQTELSTQVLDLIRQCFQPKTILIAHQGLIKQNIKKKINQEKKCTAKIAAECIYLILQIRSITQNQIPDYNINDLMLKYSQDNFDLFNEVILARKQDKNQEIQLKPELFQIITDIANQKKVNLNWHREDAQILREKLDELLLRSVENQ